MRDGSPLPVTVLNGRPGYINFLDALNSWQLVKELREATGLPAAASFKHVSPAGAAVGLPLSETDRQIYFVAPRGRRPSPPIACAYIRASGAREALLLRRLGRTSDVGDAPTAAYLGRRLWGIIAPGLHREALAILKSKKKGNYNIVRIDPDYVPAATERKDVFGVSFEQWRNDFRIDESLLKNIVNENKDSSQDRGRDMIVELITPNTPSPFRLLCEGRAGHRRRRGTAEPHPLYAACRAEGRHLVSQAAPQGAGAAVCRRHPPPGPRQRHRCLPLR